MRRPTGNNRDIFDACGVPGARATNAPAQNLSLTGPKLPNDQRRSLDEFANFRPSIKPFTRRRATRTADELNTIICNLNYCVSLCTVSGFRRTHKKCTCAQTHFIIMRFYVVCAPNKMITRGQVPFAGPDVNPRGCMCLPN